MTLALLVSVLLAWTAAKDIPLAVVVRVNGKAQAGLEKSMKPIKSGDVVSRFWRVRTEADGRVLLRLLADKALVDLHPSSLVELDLRENLAGKTVQNLSVLAGEIAFQAPAGSGDRISTATTVTTVKASSQFGMTVDLDGTTKVDVSSGTIQVCNQMTGEHVLVRSGQSQVSGYGGFDEIRTIATASSPGRVDGAALASDSLAASRTELVVPFVDPVSGKTSTLVIGVKRDR
jgi:hypothetical protein